MKNARFFNTVSMNTDIYIDQSDLLGNTPLIESMETTCAIQVVYYHTLTLMRSFPALSLP